MAGFQFSTLPLPNSTLQVISVVSVECIIKLFEALTLGVVALQDMTVSLAMKK
jgi:hypothetical protein